MPTYKGDPRWIVTRYAGKCAKCGQKIGKGERAFYRPRNRTMTCATCGEEEAAEFSAAAWDEDNNTCL